MVFDWQFINGVQVGFEYFPEEKFFMIDLFFIRFTFDSGYEEDEF